MTARPNRNPQPEQRVFSMNQQQTESTPEHSLPTHPVFVVDDTFFRSRTPSTPHWSIAWSDLMMTMFVLFLTLFIYQLAHRDILDNEPARAMKNRTVTTTLPRAVTPSFWPIHPGQAAHGDRGRRTAGPGSAPKTRARQASLLNEIFDLSRTTLVSEKLEKFASVELVPDKTMRIILTSDLLFDSGQAELTNEARRSLRKLAPIIGQTPYMINVVGHTDSVPMHSPRYPTNWELSTARACQVARFLMEEAGIPGSQIIVSGNSSFRPIRSNATNSGRRANRRVEIILSRAPVPATGTALRADNRQPASAFSPASSSLQAGS